MTRVSPPELARELPGPQESTSVTFAPLRRRWRAVQPPKAPAPTTTTRSPLLFLPAAGGFAVFGCALPRSPRPTAPPTPAKTARREICEPSCRPARLSSVRRDFDMEERAEYIRRHIIRASEKTPIGVH